MKKILLILLFSIYSLYCYGSEVFFSPNGNIRDRIISGIKYSKKTINILMYAFTSKSVASNLLIAKKRGVKIMSACIQ